MINSRIKSLLTKIGFGTWAWGNKLIWGYEPEKDDLILKETFIKAIQGGLSLIDTADSYGIGALNGRSEELLGSFLGNLSLNQRKRLTIATKLAPYPWRAGKMGLKSAFLASQKRLKGNIDRVQLHWSTSRYAPWQEINLIDGLADLLERGFLKEIGVSNFGPKRLKWMQNRLNKRGLSIKSLQVQLSLLSPLRHKNKELRETCLDLGIELIAYSPLALGILAIPPKKTKLPKTFIRKTLFKKILPGSEDLRNALKEIGKQNNASQVQVALNWCRSYGAIPIPGLRTPFQAKEAISAQKWNLTKQERNYLDEISKECKVQLPNNPFQSD